MTRLKSIIILLLGGLIGTTAFIYSGVYDIGADAPHYTPTYFLIETLRDRSIAVRASDLEVPTELESVERIRRGAGNYDAMCVGCHLKPGLNDTEIRKGLYPQPPNLAEHADHPAKQFWAIKHGIKMTAMPAWSKGGMDDETIWDMVALLQAMPDMDADKYAALVASSEGHSHAGADDHAHGGHDEEATSNTKAIESDHAHEPPHEHRDKMQMPAQNETSDHHHDDNGSKPHAH